ncbi:methyltransferase domain-containing protein [Moraxella catarrhalis]|uniref:methyltransferase domain-containing protein n=1 Tax=Moraxella catarrhalis TaxID=480 RepID=UPI0007E49E55|nr:methyltransferase domain-containing protein [Moraxella catarrhalis]OAV12226.1 Biotin synthesis protein BioC [Moraxella catarrhalis]OAV29538.1 Biotin synthesis protein BioC [Moraxella catarrhalis]
MTKSALSSNPNKIAQRFCKAHQNYRTHAAVQAKMARQLVAYLKMVKADNIKNTGIQPCQVKQHKHISRLLEIGVGSGLLTDALFEHFSVDTLYLNDLYDNIQTNALPKDVDANYLIGDIGMIDLPKTLDGVISSSALQWIYPPDMLFKRVFQTLTAGGFFAASTFVEGNLSEIQALTGRGLPYDTPKQLMVRLNQAGFMIDEFKADEQVLYFDSPMAVLRHLKATGVTAVGTEQACWSKQSLTKFCQNYQQFHTDAGYTLTYRPLLFVAHKPMKPMSLPL